MSSTVAAAVKKIAIYILGDEHKRGKVFVAVGSIIAGFLGLMFLPIAVISSIGSMNIEQPDIDKSLFTESALFESLDRYICHTLMKYRISMPNHMLICLLILRMTAI